MIEFYEKNGKYGVLVSSGYGSGWSTWNQRELAYDKRVIEYWLDHLELKTKDEVIALEEFLESIGYPDVYTGGYNDLALLFVDYDEPWRITEYDGSESLETLDNAGFVSFQQLSRSEAAE